MALNEEQQLMEDKIISAGYHLKFDVQLHALKSGLIDKNAYLEKNKIKLVDRKLTKIRQYVDNFPEESRKYIEEDLDEDGNEVEKTFTDVQLRVQGEFLWQVELDQIEENLEKNVENLSWITSEIDFRNNGLVEREPTGTTFYVDAMQNGTGSTKTNAWRYLYEYTNSARTPGDVAICRRVRGGFNTNDEIFINRYCRYKYTATDDSFPVSAQQGSGSDSLTDKDNFFSVRDTGFQPSDTENSVLADGTIIAWKSGDDYGHGTGDNRSGTAVAHGQKTFMQDEHENNDGCRNLYAIKGATPRGIYQTAVSPNGGNYQTAFHSTSRWKDFWSNTNPRDKSRLVHLSFNYWDMFHTTATNRLQPNSSGDINKPIVVTADFENLWQDFLDTGDTTEGTAGWGHDGESSQYTVEVGNKIIRRMDASGNPVEVHSYITPGDWIFVGRLTDDAIRKVDSTYSDDPYEHSYQVRDVNYDKIVLWLPYKGERAGSTQRLVSMGYAPRMFSPHYQNGTHPATESHNGSKLYASGDSNWFYQGIEFMDSWDESAGAYAEQRNTQLFFNGGCTGWKFKDCSFFGSSSSDGHQWYPTSMIWNKRHTTAIIRVDYDSNNLEFEKCVFGNTRYVVYDYYSGESYAGRNNFKFSDCVMNGAIMDNQFLGMSNPGDHYTWYWGTSARKPHRYPMSVIFSRRNDNYEFTDCEMVNWKYSMFKVMPQTRIKCRGVKFLGTGMDFVDPTSTNDADAQENLGLRYSRALFAGDNAIHPKTTGNAKLNNHLGTANVTENSGWVYDMIYPNADAHASHGPNSGNKVIETISSADDFGKFRTYDWGKMGSKSFVHTQNNLIIGDDASTTDGATTTGGAGVGTNTIDRVDSTRCYRDVGWRSDADANSGGAYGYSYQDTASTGGLEDIASQHSETQTYGSYPNGFNDNQMGQPNTSHWQGTGSTQSDWDNCLIFNGALAIIGAKGYDNLGRLVWDWDQHWRSGNANVHGITASTGCGGSWALRTSDGKVRYPHVYGGVRIPPAIPELLGRFMTWYPMFRTTPWTAEGAYKNNWITYHSNNDSGSDTDERTSNNTTLAPKNDGADNKSNDGVYWGDGSLTNTTGNYTSSENTFDWQLSNGCGFGIGCAPRDGILTMYDFSESNDRNRPMSQESKKTSQDHYQLFLNYDYGQYSAKGYLTSKYEQFNDKPLLTGVDGIGKGIVWQQGQMDHWRITSSYTYSGFSDTVGYRENSNAGDPLYRGTGYQWITPLMETVVDNDLIQSGGGNYLIKVYPPWMLGRGMELPNPHDSPDFTNTVSDNYERQWREQTSLMIFEYPFYLSKNSRTYTINVRPDQPATAGVEFSWLANPTGQDMYLEMEFFDTNALTDRSQQSRKLKRSNSGVDMNTDAWSQLSVTVTPKSEGVGYLRLWYAKARETGKVNTFYVDPKVVVY